ncbi:uncharacterized protein BO95DRAFT_468976 [Aspergillus brunneoviolaceus CBS 621.78]|uniref:Uncharacterized protein n=1 Tax=Aspergillus brunneoviolaceus CBS 621.78 TaxID=1450534 RepID=A0ACD1FTB5_9EURO|nr:hypothetical protein BO95DRAFT_468976 [Aspergillus brunneoviolaceus CBS 621.78]RAH40202.1 hypothetical protein BO95DRAFT_468976 [Aspergillus brunneoviolaceus CBS 621.78]
MVYDNSVVHIYAQGQIKSNLHRIVNTGGTNISNGELDEFIRDPSRESMGSSLLFLSGRKISGCSDHRAIQRTIVLAPVEGDYFGKCSSNFCGSLSVSISGVGAWIICNPHPILVHLRTCTSRDERFLPATAATANPAAAAASAPCGSPGASMLPGTPPPPGGTPRAILWNQPAPRERANDEEWEASLFVGLPPAAWFAGRFGGNTRRGTRPPPTGKVRSPCRVASGPGSANPLCGLCRTLGGRIPGSWLSGLSSARASSCPGWTITSSTTYSLNNIKEFERMVRL